MLKTAIEKKRLQNNRLYSFFNKNFRIGTYRALEEAESKNSRIDKIVTQNDCKKVDSFESSLKNQFKIAKDKKLFLTKRKSK